MLGPIQTVCAALPHLRKQGTPDYPALHHGVQGIFPGGSLYHASKWGVEGFFDSMMQELAPFHIGVDPPAAGTNLHFGVAQVGRKLDANLGTATSMVHPILEDSSFR